MKFFNVTNMAKFMDTIRGCEGPVYMVTPAGERVDMRGFAAQSARMNGVGLTMSALGDRGIEVIAESSADRGRLFQFMAEAARSA